MTSSLATGESLGWRIRLIGIWLLISTGLAYAGAAPIENGNTLALEFATADEAGREAIRNQALDKIYFFRYLRVTSLEKGQSEAGAWIALSTVEPSSDMKIEFTLRKTNSLKKAANLATNEAVAVSGQVKEISAQKNTMVLDPVVLRYKDRLAPKAGKELLPEVDPEARLGTVTSNGEEVILRTETKINR